ncbi:hypothetical protein IEO21_07958 [Rhodonia placenta]|uniref:Uncharacterized protein n=1 Tax=Rhodonia placenta TaxID=104341 RepID=A0A8H7TZP2_9APHY|nr:hypothetical protein IEO21_07958 [Postia placenta]
MYSIQSTVLEYLSTLLRSRQNVTDIELRRRVAEITDTWDFGESMHPHINTALVLAESAYDHLTDLNAKVIITVLTALLTSTDDSNALDGLGFDQFHRRHLDCTLHADKSRMGLLANVLSQMVECFPNFGAGTILVSVLQIVNGRKLESIARETTLHQKALPFVEYRRMVTGGPEAYAYMIWEKARFPTVDSYIQAIPDILSYYKEELANELSNYIHDRVIVTGIAPSDTLRNVIDESVSASERVSTAAAFLRQLGDCCGRMNSFIEEMMDVVSVSTVTGGCIVGDTSAETAVS